MHDLGGRNLEAAGHLIRIASYLFGTSAIFLQTFTGSRKAFMRGSLVRNACGWIIIRSKDSGGFYTDMKIDIQTPHTILLTPPYSSLLLSGSLIVPQLV